MKVCAYIPLHYGAEYLAASIQSYNDLVDEIFILYTSTPSYGHTTGIECPESEWKLRDIANSVSSKISWVNISAISEAEHRDMMWYHTREYDVVVATDYDEIWLGESLQRAIKEAYDQPFKRYRIDGFINFWKSFDKVCLDGFRPVRIYKHSGVGESELKATVYHFGYAIAIKTMIYKWAIHGHKYELRPDWIEDVYMSDKETDLHPVSISLWNSQSFDKTTLPEFMKQHPNFNKVSCL